MKVESLPCGRNGICRSCLWAPASFGNSFISYKTNKHGKFTFSWLNNVLFIMFFYYYSCFSGLFYKSGCWVKFPYHRSTWAIPHDTPQLNNTISRKKRHLPLWKRKNDLKSWFAPNKKLWTSWPNNCSVYYLWVEGVQFLICTAHFCHIPVWPRHL